MDTPIRKYLLETRQIDALACRQADVVCSGIGNQTLHNEAMLVVLLVLAALQKGSPRADKMYLLQPIEQSSITRYRIEISQRNDSTTTVPSDAETWYARAADIVDRQFESPSFFAPLSGAAPINDAAAWPLLVVGKTEIGFSRQWAAVKRLEERYFPQLLTEPMIAVNTENVRTALHDVFVTRGILGGKERYHFRQIAAAALACRSRFLIVSGGPGTGKTSVVLQLLRTLCAVFPDITPERIVLCAPTGKAKARLEESVAAGIGHLQNGSANTAEHPLHSFVRKTIHGVLGIRRDGSFFYNSERKLPYRVVVVDEVSMVDVQLFAALLAACSVTCRVILVGDMHQLPSVETGALLGDCTQRFSTLPGQPTLTGECATWVESVTGGIPADYDDALHPIVLASPEDVATAGSLANRTIVLTTSYRTRGAALRQFAELINCGNAAGAESLLTNRRAPNELSIDTRDGAAPIEELAEKCLSTAAIDILAKYDGITLHKEDALPEGLSNAVKDTIQQHIVLTLAHEGERGRIAINRMADALYRRRYKETGMQRCFHGQPVILTINHHALDLYNGDVGVVIRTSPEGLKVLFPRKSGVAIVQLERLTNLDPAFALTVHKSQGSEYNHVTLVLPDHRSPLLTRQLIYTAVTRAKESVRIVGSMELLKLAICTREERVGGVRL